MTGARPGQVPGPRTSALVQEKLVPVLASPKIQFMSAFPLLEFLGPLEIGEIVWNTAGLTGGARCSSATVHPGPVKKNTLYMCSHWSRVLFETNQSMTLSTTIEQAHLGGKPYTGEKIIC